ncbi:MAG: twin-arginine translocase subunit TatC [Bacteroidales bacterium]|nr:twin-arginine translocase subunit TatC [Bacteroidales bacterium]
MLEEKTFWEHLDDLRKSLFKIAICVGVCFVVCFALKDTLFSIVLFPKQKEFITYSLLGVVPTKINLISTEIAGQMMMHLKTAFVAAIVLASPYIIWVLFSFIAPALYEKERKYSLSTVVVAYLMFILGALINYFIIFPITVNFLASYQVAGEVSNLLTLQSYMNTLMMMTLVFGIVFEIPILSWLLAKMGILKSSFMKNYRKHAIVIILIAAAIITPTSDIFTLSIVFLPIWLLYEASIVVVKQVERKNKRISIN